MKVLRPAQRLWIRSTFTIVRSSIRAGGERDLIFVGLCVARFARHFVHRRGEQPAALRREIELVADRLGERQAIERRSRAARRR